PDVGGDELRHRDLGEERDVGIAVAGEAHDRLRLGQVADRTDGRVAVAHPSQSVAVERRAREDEGAVIERARQVHVDVEPIGRLARVGRDPRAFAKHQGTLLRRGEPFVRGKDERLPGGGQQLGDLGQPRVATAQEVLGRVRRAAVGASVLPLAEIATATVPAPPGVAASALEYSATAWSPDARSRAATTAAAYRDEPIPRRTTRRVPGGIGPQTGASSSASASA